MNAASTSLHISRANTPARQTALRVLCAATCAWFFLNFLYGAFANYWPGPFVDYWIDIPNVEKFFNGELTLHDLISAHANVHRLFIPRLLFIADYQFFRGSNVLLVWVSILCKVATLLLFNRTIKDQALNTRIIINVLLFAAIFNSANLSNVLHNSNMQWDLASVFACFALYFYTRNSATNTTLAQRLITITAAWVFFACGFLSQAGALPVIFVFVFISALNKRWLESLMSLALVVFVLYLTFVVLPVNEPEKPTYENALAMMIFKLKYVAIYVFKMFSGSIYPLDSTFFIFSWTMLALLLLSLVFAYKTRKVYNNIFLAMALFAFLMMVTIAAARVDFAPNTWSANRYQTNVLLFVLSLSLHSYFSVTVWLSNNTGIMFRNVIFIFSLGSFFITQYYLNNYPAIFANKVFNAQAYMLTHGVNQYNGADLLPSLQQQDRIAEPDPFFRKYGLAYYNNKQAAQGAIENTKHIGDELVTDANLAAFDKQCSTIDSPLQYTADPSGQGYSFSSALTTRYAPVALVLLARNTYYTLDTRGSVIGFSYLATDPEHPYRRTNITGYTNTKAANYIAQVNRSGNPVCLYRLHNAPPAENNP